MTEPARPERRSWTRKFYDAFRGLWVGLRGQSSFAAHLVAALLVVTAAAVLRIQPLGWCLLVLSIAVVLAAEMFNTALERLAKAIDSQENPHLRDALDVGSAAVLLAVLGAAAVGAIVFLHRIATLLGWLAENP